MIQRIDLSTLARGAMPAAVDPEYVRQVVEGLAHAARAHWDALAGQRLRSTSAAYRAGILPVEVGTPGGEIVGTVTLEGILPNMIEHGWAARDLRASLLGARSRRRPRRDRRGAQVGWYNVVPFRHGTPGTSGRNVGAPMPAPIHDMARDLKATLSAAGRPTQWGSSLPGGTVPKLRAHHVTDPYAGMYRFAKTYARATQSQYRTFRTISDSPRQDPRSWQHPGIKPADFLREVTARVAELAPAAFAAARRP